MLKLTSKNYEQLPEVMKKKQDDSKKDELKRRFTSVKELEKQRRASVVGKKMKTSLKLEKAWPTPN